MNRIPAHLHKFAINIICAQLGGEGSYPLFFSLQAGSTHRHAEIICLRAPYRSGYFSIFYVGLPLFELIN